MSYGSPYRGSTPNPDYYYSGSPSPTPSPRHNYFYSTPQRPATRAHFRNASSGGQDNYRTTFSPRYTSTGEYATGPGPKVSSRKHSFSKGSNHTPKRERRGSYSYYRTSYGDSDEDEIFEVNGVTYVLPAQSRSRRHQEYYTAAAGHGTDYHYYKQGPVYEKERPVYYDDPIQRSATRVSHTRRPSGTAPIQRPQTVRPSSSHQKKAAPTTVKATEADAKKHRIPAGYSLKNWDPTEEPIMLLGSVFDSNSLGKWIYDWTVYHHGPATPISDMAGELWLLLIQLSGKIKRSEDTVPRIRAQDNREMVEDFIESGERLTDKLRALLKRCESPMLKASKRKDASQLGKGSGVEFVETLFGRERELEKTERFMQQTRLWNLRFDANCEEILKKPTM
ncbi:vegetative cell wall protein gp1 [Seiridium cupressi]|uniref:Vegetative cell wall protein gp1 n=1 Tax=Seiridium unicorne TaxID=138068 RepID=A0ABR2UXN5_9PEZI